MRGVATIDEERRFLNELIGAPWVEGAEGPQGFYCWGLCRYVWRHLRGVELPEVVGVNTDSALDVARAVLSHSRNGAHWEHVSKPRRLDIVVMGGCKHAVHLGVYLDDDEPGVLHAERGAGVRFTPLRMLTYSTVEFWRYSGGDF